ncbi:hypothetical protein JD844_009682 [Phrynosoma platyrhinos]|uniref:Immunoglobulin I-set domain-containing protein n=1 Tax=Phrynosoma platyrhinos TaxID=52577 RepID=A0ABQ7TFF0_PHRPL|nr:hypothetical protein JD844_009682 [Phrynosoma platyrhinos]
MSEMYLMPMKLIEKTPESDEGSHTQKIGPQIQLSIPDLKHIHCYMFQVTESPKGVKLLEELPGDRVNMAIQVRGGPSKHESTGWVLINPLTKEDEGIYQCHATNMVGETQAEGNIKVLEQNKYKKAHFQALEDKK